MPVNISTGKFRAAGHDFDMKEIHLYNADSMPGDKMNDNDESFVPEQEVQTPEEVDIEDVEERAEDTIKSLKKRLKEVEKERAQCLEDLQRSRADFLNGKRRLTEQLEADRERITDAYLNELLPLMDSFDLALSKNASAEVSAGWRKGIEAVRSQFASLLTKYGVEEIVCEGKEFDPELHEAVSNAEGSGDEIGKVVAVIQKGYRRDERVLRPARVTVGV